MVFFQTVMNPSNLISIMRHAVSSHNLDRRTFCFVIKTGAFVRCIVWPLLPPIMLYQYIRAKDEDMFAVELLKDRSHLEDSSKSFYDANIPNNGGHWRMQADLKLIHDGVRAAPVVAAAE
jgi:hypothetical protein